MPLTNDVITNRTNKKVNYGVARTDYDVNKGPINESIPSPLPNPAHDLWINSDQIPSDGASPPTENTSDIKVYEYNNSSSNVEGILELTVSTEVAGNRTWLCCSTPGDESSNLLKNWIRISYGGAYLVTFAVGPRNAQHINLGHSGTGSGIGSGNVDPSSLTPIYEGFPGQDFYFDYEAGVLTFADTNLPTGVSDADTNSVYLIKGYRYDGPIGFKNANWTSLVTIDYSQLTIPDTPWLTRVAEVNDPVTNIDSANVHTLLFDVDSGFALDENNPGEITVRMESTFKTWKVYEDISSPTSTDVIATAVDTISLFGGNGIKLDADPNIGSKALTINYDNDFINPISNLALQAKTFETNEYEKFVTESGDNIMEENGDVSSNLPSTVRIMSDLKTGAHYLDYTNFTNVPFGLANTQDIVDTVNKTFVDALGINADQLDSYDGSYYLNYDNFTNPNGTSDFVGLDYFTFHTITFEDSTVDINGTSMSGDTMIMQDSTDHVVLEESNNIDVLTESNFTNTFGVGDLHNVSDGANSGSVANGMVLLYDSSTSLWTPSTIGQVSQGVFQSFTGTQLLGLISTVGTPVPSFDADLLDSQEGSYYLDYTKFTNTPQKYSDFEDDSGNKITNISSMNVGFLGGNDSTHFLNYDNFFNEPGVSFFNNDAGYQIASDVTTLIDKTHVDALGINATHLNGYDENDLYSNLVGRPLDLSEFTNSLDYQTLNDITTIVTNDNDISASLLQYKERILTNDDDNICLENGDVTLNLSSEHKFRTEEYIAYDAQHYSNYNNLENIPPGLANTVNVQTAITDTVDKDFVELFNIDAVFLDGQTGSHYLNYLNFYNEPTDLSEFNNDTNFQNLTEVDTAISTYVTNTVDKDFVENLGIDSSILTHSEDFITQDGFKLKEENDEASQNIPSENNIVTEIDERNSDYYLDYVNFTNTPQDLSDFTNLFNFANTVEVDTAIDTKVNKSFVEGLNIDVTSFDGNDSSYYLNYNNLNNRPQNVSSFVNDENFASENFVTSTLTNTVTKTFIEDFDIDAKTLNHPEDIVFEPATIDKDGNLIGNFKIEYNFAAFNSYDNLVVTEIDLRDSDYYLNYLNFTNTPQDLSEFTNLFNFANTVEVDTAIDTKVDKEFVENLNITSANTVLLNDELPTYYLDYSNFTNTPQDLSEFTNLFNFANTQQIQDAVDDLVDSAPGALDTLNELAASLNDDANFAATVTNELSLKANTAQLSNVVFSSSYTDLYDVPIDLHEFTNDTNFANNTQVDQQIDTRVTKTFVDDLNVDANSLRYIETLLTQGGDIIVEENGRVIENLPSDVHILSEASGEENYDFYLDYTNFTNVPTDVSTFVNDKDYANTSQVNTQIHTTVTKDYVDPLGINASHLQYSQPFIVEDYNTIDDLNDPHPLMHWSYDNLVTQGGENLVSDETAHGGEFYLNNTNLTIPTNTSDLTNILKWEMVVYDNYQHGSGGASEISLIPTSDAVLVNGEWVTGTEYDLVNSQGQNSDTWKLTRDNSGQGTAFDFPQYFKNNCVPGDIIRVRQTRNHFSLGDHSSDDIYYPFSSAGGANDNWTDFEYVGISGYLQSGDVILKKSVTNTYSAPQDLSNTISPVTHSFITIWRLYSDNFSTRINVNKSIQDNIKRTKIVDEFYNASPTLDIDLHSNANKELIFNANNLTNHISSSLTLYHSGAMETITQGSHGVGATFQEYYDVDYHLISDHTQFSGQTAVLVRFDGTGPPGGNGSWSSSNNWNPLTSRYETWISNFQLHPEMDWRIWEAYEQGYLKIGDKCLLRIGGDEDVNSSSGLERHITFQGHNGAKPAAYGNPDPPTRSIWYDGGGDDINVSGSERKRLWIKPKRIFVNPEDITNRTIELVNKDFVDRLDVNSDTLDSQEGSYYLDYSNFTNIPSFGGLLGEQEIQANYLEHILQITTEDNDLIIFDHTDPFEFVTEDGSYYIISHDDLNIVHDSERDLLYLHDEGRRDSTFFLDYTNFTNTPQNIGDFTNDRDFANTTQIQNAISGETDIAASSLVFSIYLTTEFGDNVVEENGDVTLNLTSDIKFIEEDRTREAEYFLEYSNFTNTPQNIGDFTNDRDFANTTQVESLISSTKLSGLDDVDNYGPAGDPNAPSVGQVLAWTGTKWGVTNQSGGSGGGSGGAVTLDGLLDVDTSTVVPSTAQILQYDMNGNQEWTNQTLYSNTITIGQSVQDFGGSGMLDGVSTMIHSGQNVADAFDILNETILNLYTQTYVRDALFTFATVGEESGHQNHYHVPLTLQFTDDETFPKLEPEGPTHTWTFEHADANTGVIYWPGHTAAGQTVVESGTSEAYKNPTHTWNEVGTFKVTHKMELLGGTAMFPGSAGSFAENFTYITTIPPLPIPNFSVSPSQLEIDLDGGGTTVNFSDGSQFATHFMYEWGDGTVHPVGASSTDPLGTTSGVPWDSTGTVSHLYQSTYSQQFTVKLHVYHTDHNNTTGGIANHCITEEKVNYISGYIALNPTFSITGGTLIQGNNQAPEDNVAAGNANLEGHKVEFTDTTAGMSWGFGQSLQWNFSANPSDGPDIQKTDGSNGYTETPTNIGLPVTRYFKRDNTSASATVNYDVTLTAVNGHSNSPFTSAPQTVIVDKDPRSNFSYEAKNNNTGGGDYEATNIGYEFIGYGSGTEYNWMTFTDTSENVDGWSWDFDNDGTVDQVTQGPHDYLFVTGTYSTKLIATNSSLSQDYHWPTIAEDDTEIKNGIITIRPAPSAPSGLGSTTLTSFPASVGDTPRLVTGHTNNDSNSTTSPGQNLNRQVGTAELSAVMNTWANKFPSNGDNSGTLTAVVNGTDYGSISLGISQQITTAGNSGDGQIEITDDVDANDNNSSTYPIDFYRQFKAKIKRDYNTRGVNTFQIKYTDTNGDQTTDIITWVHDTISSVPVINTPNLIETVAGSTRNVSGIPYYNTGATLQVTGLTCTNISGETYREGSDFIKVDNDTGTIISTQNKNYSDVLAMVIPVKDLGALGAYSINNFDVPLNGSSGKGTSTLKLRAKTVTGETAYSSAPQILRYWKDSVPVDETNLGNGWKRVLPSGWTGQVPQYTPANFVSTDAYSGTTSLAGLSEAVVNFNGEIVHDETDYSGELPVGPDYSSGRSGTQYINFAANKVTGQVFMSFTGELASAWLAIPGVTEPYSVTYVEDGSSVTSPSGHSGSTYGWLDMANFYGYSGNPGSNGGGNNGYSGIDNFDAEGSDQLLLNTPGTYNCKFTFGGLFTSNSGNKNNCIVVRLGIAPGKKIENLTLSFP